MKTYKVLLAITGKVILNSWVDFAMQFLPEGGEIHLRALVAIDPDKSLSEGALPARDWRETFRQTTAIYEAVSDDAEVFVDYQPFQRVIEEIQQKSIDLVLVEWFAIDEIMGGTSVEDFLKAASCDVVLLTGIQDIQRSNSVLLALRGGPNLTIGARVARALANQEAITLFHAVDRYKTAPDLKPVMRAMPQITRIVTAVTGIVNGIVYEATGHDIIVMGAGFRHPDISKSPKLSITRQVYERTHKPIVLVEAATPETLDFHIPHLVSKEEEPLSVRVDRWFAENTFHSREFNDLNMLMTLKEKQGVTISIALPALNEAETVEKVIKTIKLTLMDDLPLVDEIVLIDSNSTDNTVAIAQDCGIPTYTHQQILVDEVGSYSGKGEALWKSLHVTKGDIIAWIDTDITNIHPRFIYGLLGPILKNQQVQYVKGFYTRPIEIGGNLQAYGGGRVTELVARPMLNLFYPALSGIIQPLSGEYAGRRTALEQVPFFSGYGVETGLLIDLLDRFGLNCIAQSDLEVRVHHNQPLLSLSKMSFAILQVFIARLENRFGVELLNEINRSMKLVIQEPERFALDIAEIGDHERPPMITLSSYESRYKS